jgi:hypothetical protein
MTSPLLSNQPSNPPTDPDLYPLTVPKRLEMSRTLHPLKHGHLLMAEKFDNLKMDQEKVTKYNVFMENNRFENREQEESFEVSVATFLVLEICDLNQPEPN